MCSVFCWTPVVPIVFKAFILHPARTTLGGNTLASSASYVTLRVLRVTEIFHVFI